jgi:methylase of polypeptide subunit release factors
LPGTQVDLLEIDSEAMKIAQINVDKFTLQLPVIKSDLLTTAPHNYAVLLCNLPYVRDDFQINLSAGHEPRLAIFGGPDGLDVYRKLFEQLHKRSQKPLYILTESLPPQHLDLELISKAGGYQLEKTVDFIQQFKYHK